MFGNTCQMSCIGCWLLVGKNKIMLNQIPPPRLHHRRWPCLGSSTTTPPPSLWLTFEQLLYICHMMLRRRLWRWLWWLWWLWPQQWWWCLTGLVCSIDYQLNRMQPDGFHRAPRQGKDHTMMMMNGWNIRNKTKISRAIIHLIPKNTAECKRTDSTTPRLEKEEEVVAILIQREASKWTTGFLCIFTFLRFTIFGISFSNQKWVVCSK